MAQVLHAVGVPSDAGLIAGDSLALADARGLHSHGVDRTGIYVRRIQSGSIDPKATPTVIEDSGAIVLLDAQHGLGIVSGYHGVRRAIDKARTYGIAACGVRNSGHFGMAGYFALIASEERMICIAMSGADALVAPFGAGERFIGTNPFAVSIPADKEPALLADMATSVVAAGKIALAESEGASIPEGWALDPEGRPTTDPALGLKGALLPFGGPKGSAIGLVIDLLCGAMIGGPSSRGIAPLYEDLDRPQEVGHCFIVIDPRAFGAEGPFLSRVGEELEALRRLRPAQGFSQVAAPGEIEYRRSEAGLQDGVALPEPIYTRLAELGAEFGLPEPLEPDINSK